MIKVLLTTTILLLANKDNNRKYWVTIQHNAISLFRPTFEYCMYKHILTEMLRNTNTVNILVHILLALGYNISKETYK